MLIREFVGQTLGQGWHYLRHYDADIPFCWHYHPEYELTLSRNVSGTRYLGSDVEGIEHLDLFLVAPNQAHTLHVLPLAGGQGEGPPQVQVIFFTHDWLRRLLDSGLPELAVFSTWLAGVGAGVVFSQPCTRALLPLFDLLHESRDLARLTALLSIFDALLRDPAARHLGIPGQSRTPDGQVDPRVDLALGFLQKEYRRSIRLTDVAAAAATSPATIKRLFRKRLGISVTDVLIQLRVGHACHLLISSPLPVQLVAEASGHESQANFFKQFSDRRGVSPAEFRRRHQLREYRHKP